MAVIGEDSSERLDVLPVQDRVVAQAPAPARLIEGGIPTEALVAQVAVARFADHQPLYRQAPMMARQGVILAQSTNAYDAKRLGCRRLQRIT
jgi:transposase